MKSTVEYDAFTQPVQNMFSFLKNACIGYLLFPETINRAAIVDSITADRTLEVEDRVPAVHGKSRQFSDAEVERMYTSTRHNPWDLLILTILREIGLRISAICHLKYGMLLDEHHIPRQECLVPEKRRSKREFVTSDTLRERLCAYVDTIPPEHRTPESFLLSRSDWHSPVSRSTVSGMLKRVAMQAGVKTPMHAHAFRYTVVGKLIECGNSIEKASKYMGHKSVKTTEKFYFVSTIKELKLNNPFTGTYHRKRDREGNLQQQMSLLRDRERLMREIICTYNQAFSDCLEGEHSLLDWEKRVFELRPRLGAEMQQLDDDEENISEGSLSGDSVCTELSE